MGKVTLDNGFFDECEEQSRVKATIVSKYFWAWAKVVMPTAKKQTNRIAYIDLFAGPGRYKDGTKSTPLLVLEKAIEDPDMREMLVSLFNDVNSDNSDSLGQAIRDLPGIETLRYAPVVENDEVIDHIVKEFESRRLIPTLFFVDPYGYKGLSLRLINSVIKDWGCDCIFFFNYNRINMGLGNQPVKDHMDALFGKERADELRDRLVNMSPWEREAEIVEEISQALKEMGGNYVLPFCFRNEQGTRTSHHLIFVTKHVRGYDIMKDIMARESSGIDQRSASFQYCPATERQPFLFQFAGHVDDLEGLLLREFAGRTLSMLQVFREHNVGRPYVKSDYKVALKSLEAKGSIVADPSAESRRKNQMADTVMVSFPKL